MDERILIRELKNCSKNSKPRDIMINGKKYRSTVSEKTVKKLYDLLYKNLSQIFDENIIKERLIFAEEEYLIIEFVVSRNKKYQFILLDEKTEKLLYFENYHSENNVIHFNNRKNELLTIDEALEVFENQYSILKEKGYFNIKPDSFEERIYIKAAEHYELAILIRDGLKKANKSEVLINLVTASRYIKEILNKKCDKDFMGEIYLLSFRIEDLLKLFEVGGNSNTDYTDLRKAIKCSPNNEKILIAALQYLAIELVDLEINNDTKAILNYLYENIDKVEVKKESIFNNHIHEIISKDILDTFNGRHYRKEYTDKIVYVYETLLKKLKEEEHPKVEELEELVYELKKAIKK